MRYEIIDLSNTTFEDLVNRIKFDFMYNQNNTIFILNEGKYVKSINYEMFSTVYPNFTKEFFCENDGHEEKYSYLCELNEKKELKKVISNDDYNPRTNFFMDKDRWNILYKNNNDIIDFIRKQNIQKIIITGDFGEDIYHYIKKYGLDIDVIYIPNNQFLTISKKYNDYIVIDANNESSLLRSKLVDNNTYYPLLEFCNLVEFDVFNNNFLNNYPNNFVFVKTSLDLSNYYNLSHEAKERCKKPFKRPYRYKDYLKSEDPIIKALVKKFYGDFYDEVLIEDVCYPAQLMIVNGLLKQSDMNNPNFHIINGKRITQGENTNGNVDINFYGTCLVYGQMVSDQDTIPSCFYNILENKNQYNVHNLGLPTNSLAEIIRTINKNGIKSNSINLIFYLDSEEEILNKLNVQNQIEMTDVINNALDSNTVIDNILHCNQSVNSEISKYLYKQIKKIMVEMLNEPADKIRTHTSKDLYSNNKYVENNVKMLKEFKRDGNNGAIVLHGNPFTKGHYELAKYASNLVDTLYIFVLQEDRGVIKFEDRYIMARESCAELDNVIVLPSGEFLGSKMLFSEYGNKNIDESQKIDSLDDTEFFCQVVAKILNIKKRFVGEEEYDLVTNHLNQELKKVLPQYGLECIEVPRFRIDGRRISAHTVRKLIEQEKLDELSIYLPSPVIEILYEKNYPEIIKQKNNERVKQKKIGGI